MIYNFEYKNKTYKIIEGINIAGVNFVICIDKNNKLSYMKITQLEAKSVFTPLEKMIQVFGDYNNQKIYNIQKVLNYFTERLNKSLQKRLIKDYEINDIVIEFNEYIKNKINQYIIDDYKLTKKEIRMIDRFVTSKEKRPLYMKLCNSYGLLILICIICLGVFSKNLMAWYSEGKESKKIVEDIISDTEIVETEAFENEEIVAILDEQQEPEEEVNVDEYSYNYWAYSNTTIMSVDFSNLIEVNPDTVGWIFVNNTKINYPVVQSGDNSYYLTHSFKKTYNEAGWLFADYRSNLTNLEKNTVIYGHGRLDNVMFGSLDDVLSSSWYTNPENQIIKLSTPSKNMLWQIVSIYTIPSESYYLTHTFENNESYNKFLNTILGRSIYNFNVGVTTEDNILTLSTCLDNNGNRIVVHAKLIKSEER